MKIFLDLDGVLSDFVSAACLIHDRANPYLIPENCGTFDLAGLLEMSNSKFFAPLSGSSFWKNMALTEEANAIFFLAQEFVPLSEICILSTPTLDPQSLAGKQQWVDKHFPELSRQTIFTAAKHFVAHSNAVLIDDRDENVERFCEEGGFGILVPRPWNAEWNFQGDVISVLRHRLQLAKEVIGRR